MIGIDCSNKRQAIRGKAAFTLVEVLVVLGLFSLLSLVIINVFLSALQSQRQTALRQKTVSNLRYVIETMAKQIKTAEVDYSFYGISGLGLVENQLALVDQAGRKLVYALSGSGINLAITKDNVTEQAFLTNSEEIKVVKLLFYVQPKTNPFSEERCNDALADNGCLLPTPIVSCTINDPSDQFKSGFCQCGSGPLADNTKCASKNCDPAAGVCLPFNQQPRVTIVLGFESVGTKIAEQKRVYLQTTVSSRVYKR